MEAMPKICPACGELIIVWPQPDGQTMVAPVHPDRVFPFLTCSAVTDSNGGVGLPEIPAVRRAGNGK